MLTKKNRLTKKGSFTFVYNKGLRKNASTLGLIYVRGKTLKVGFSVSNKIGKAVIRNKLKRRLRSIVRELIPRIQTAQIVIATKPGAEKLEFLQLKQIVFNLFNNAKLLGINEEKKD